MVRKALLTCYCQRAQAHKRSEYGVEKHDGNVYERVRLQNECISESSQRSVQEN